MANYIIEGTITEIANETSNEVLFKLIGIEGYALKIGKKKYNVLCTKELIKDSKKKVEEDIESKYFEQTIIFSSDIQFVVNDMVKLFLIRSNGLGHHVKIEIKDDFGTLTQRLKDENKLSVTSITLLSD